MKKKRITTHAKCILLGEHAVLRGSPALVAPVFHFKFSLFFIETGLPVEAKASGPYADRLLLLFWGLLEAALQQLKKKHRDISGQFLIENSIPMGAGLGFSAAFCAAIGQWFLSKAWITAPQLIEFSRKLENSFHGKSSGVDIAGVLATQVIRFDGVQKQGQSLPLSWLPRLYLSYSNQISVTTQCIEQVSALWARDPVFAQEIDKRMQRSVDQAERALCGDPEQGPQQLKIALLEAYTCFQDWGLISAELENHMQALRAVGALAVKPTGAGIGGYVLSFWDQEPPKDLGFALLPFDLLQAIARSKNE